MADLIAQGREAGQRWRRRLPEETTIQIGRSPGAYGVTWDPLVSRQHVHCRIDGRRLHVTRVEHATNPIFFRGQQLDEFYLDSGDWFVIGQTRVVFVRDPARVTVDHPSPDAQRKFAADKLRKAEYRDAAQRIAVLAQLPDVISRAINDDELMANLVNVLMTGVRRANAVAIARVSSDRIKPADTESDAPAPEESDPAAGIEVLHWDERLVTERGLVPSGSLIRAAVTSGETVLHLWKTGGVFGDDQATVLQDGDWAYACPVGSDNREPLVIYVSGNYASPIGSDPTSDPLDLRDDIKFTELVASTLANLRHVKNLERHQAGLRSFFSPVVLDALAGASPDAVLAPRECEVSVMFCDLRGFSRKSEQAANDLMGLLDRVSRALGVTTRQILDQGGVVGDFHGDAAMGFWGWPLEQPDKAARACQAAMEIQRQFADFGLDRDDPLNDFQVGIGVATGKAVAGRIGTDDQVKVTVFGPVVNLAARLESMNRLLHTGILIDDRTDALLRTWLASQPEVPFRVRRLAIVQPAGMQKTISISQILPPASADFPLTDEHLARYESALDAFTEGRWTEAFELLHGIPATDTAKDFLTVQIAQHNRSAPRDWPGYIALQQK